MQPVGFWKMLLWNFRNVLLIFVLTLREKGGRLDNHSVYISKNSNYPNYPKTFLRKLLKSISKRWSDLSSNKDIFQKATAINFEALKKKMDLMNL